MKSFPFINRIKDALTSPLRVGALEISATAIKYLLIRGNSIVQASLRLPPGTLDKGRIKNRAVLLETLKNVHTQLVPLQKPVTIILTVPSALVFAQSFSIPIVAKEHLEEAIRLNLQVISPNKVEESYIDYQEIKVNKDLGHIDLLGAFSARVPIDEYETVLREANLIPVSVEFPGLSLARLVRERWGGIELEQEYLLTYLSSEGILMMILKNGNLAFNHFTSWQDAGSSAIEPLTFGQVKEFTKRELQRVINFHLGRTGKTIEEVILISPVFNYEIVTMASEELKLKIRNLTIPELPKLSPSWFPALGAALRGLVSRSNDTDISLAATNTQTEYYQERTLNFISLWRNILVGSLVIMLAAFILTDLVFSREQSQLHQQLVTGFNESILPSSVQVKNKIALFNGLLDTIDKLSTREVAWSPILQGIAKTASTSIILDRVFIGKKDLKGIISGRGQSDEAILMFKDRLLADPRVAAVDLPLSNIHAESDRSASFSLAITLKSL